MDNKRRFSRVTAIFDVTLTTGAGQSVVGTLRDVAIQGAFVTCSPALALGTVVDSAIVLHGGIDDISVKARAEVVRHEESGLGIHFLEIDLDSVEHLRNIIKYNAEDPDEVLEEMQGGHPSRELRHSE